MSKIVFLWLLHFVASLGQTPYECGLHGRFEYCIDGIPGCVVGCHCHPGFYFDTETKICESSAKIFQESRRFYSPPLPYRAQQEAMQQGSMQGALEQGAMQQGSVQQKGMQQLTPQIPQNPFFQQTPFSKSPAQSELLSEIAEYVAGDQEPEKEEDLEEWLYNQFSKTIESQIKHKNGAKPSRRSGGDGLTIPARRKVTKPQTPQVKKASPKPKKAPLRAIDENDSLFEDASSDEGNGGGGSGEKGECKNEGKKMIIIKKAPKMPLPPFIFMPQADGSYYPANGLAPPPPMTLFPIVPVPPMMPMMPMMPASCDNATTTTAATTTTSTTSTTEKNDTLPGGRSRVRKRKPNPFLVAPFSRSNNNVNRIASVIGNLANNANEQDELLPNVQSPPFDSSPRQTLRKNRNNGASPRRLVSNPAVVNPSARRSAVRDLATDSEPDEPAPGFQYLTDLIHTFDSPTKQVQPMNYNSFGLVPQKKKAVSVDDTYFTNLGKEIVTIMNKMDKVGSDSDSDGSKSLLNPKVVWDRQVRSPSPKNVKVKSKKTKSSEDLIHLEKEVYAAATSAPALSLAELEEKIRKVDEEFINIESDTLNEEDAIVLNQPFSHVNVNLLESANLNPISDETKNSGSLAPNPIQSVLIHSELRHSEPVASALIHFEIRGSDPTRPVNMHTAPVSAAPVPSAPIRPAPIRPSIRPAPIRPAPLHPSRMPIPAVPSHKSTTSTPTFESSLKSNNSQHNHAVHLYKNLKPVYKKSKKQRRPSLKNSTSVPSISNNTWPKSIHKEIKYNHLNIPHVVSSAVLHKEPRHTQASYSPPKMHLEHKPHSKLLKNHHHNNKISQVETYNVKNTSLFGNSFGYNKFQPNNYLINNPIASSPPPLKLPLNRQLSSYEKWEFDKQQFYYPKLNADMNSLNRLTFINEQQMIPEAKTEHPVNPPLNSPMNPPMNPPINPPTAPQEDMFDPYPYHHKLYRQYFFPYAGRGIQLRDQETPSWYFDTR